MGAERLGEFTVYKKGWLATLTTVIRLETSFCSATYRPKAHRPIYRDLGALVHSKYLHPSVRRIALIVGYYKTGLNRDVRSDAPIPRKQPSGLRDKRRSVGGGPRVRIHLPPARSLLRT